MTAACTAHEDLAAALERLLEGEERLARLLEAQHEALRDGDPEAIVERSRLLGPLLEELGDRASWVRAALAQKGVASLEELRAQEGGTDGRVARIREIRERLRRLRASNRLLARRNENLARLSVDALAAVKRTVTGISGCARLDRRA